MLHTDKQTNKQINAGKNIYLLVEVNNNKRWIDNVKEDMTTLGANPNA